MSSSPLWTDKHAPHRFEDGHFVLHAAIEHKLKALAADRNIPHLVFCGPMGSGKKSLVNCLLAEIYGLEAAKTKIDTRTFETASGRKIEMQMVTSPVHIEINPSDTGIYDRVIIQDLVKEMAQTQSFGFGATQASQNVLTTQQPLFKTLLINEAENLTKDAQHALRRTMERYMRNMRIFLLCSNGTKLIAPIRSRCLVLRVPAPDCSLIAALVERVAAAENVAVAALPEAAAAIAANSGGSVRRALLALQCATVRTAAAAGNGISTKDFVTAAASGVCDWEATIDDICALLVGSEQTAAVLLGVRTKFYELLSHCVPAPTVIEAVCVRLQDKVDQELKIALFEDAAEYDSRIHTGQKAIFHLEAFAAKFMCSYKRFLAQMCC